MADPFVIRAAKRALSPTVRGRLRFQLCTRIPTRAAILFCRLFQRERMGAAYSNILVVRLDGLGDCVMTLPLLNELRRCYPASTISIVVQQGWAPLLEGESSVDHVLPLRPVSPRYLPKSAWQFCSCIRLYFKFLRGKQYDLVINPRWDADYYLATMLCALTLAPVRVGYEDDTSSIKKEENAAFQHAYSIIIEAGPLRHEVLRNLEVVRALGHQPRRLAPSLRVPDQQRGWAGDWLGGMDGKALLVLGLPAAAAMRRWDAGHYVDLLHRVAESHALEVVAIVDAATSSNGNALTAEFPQIRLAANLPLVNVAALIERCGVYVGGDSGLAHMAAALGCPVVVLSPHPLGAEEQHANSPIRFRPYGDNVHVLRPHARSGCEQHCAASEAHCILDIDPRDVASFIDKELRARGKTAPSTFAAELPIVVNEISVVDPQMEWI